MFVAAAIVSILLALVMTASAVGMLTRQPRIVDAMSSIDLPHTWFPYLGALKLAGAAGLIVGLWVPAIGIAAAAGLALYFAGAVIAHLRAGDREIGPPAVLAVVSIVALVLRAASA